MGWYNGRILSGRGGRDMFRGGEERSALRGKGKGEGDGLVFLLGGEGKF